jgi:hypothetical protein
VTTWSEQQLAEYLARTGTPDLPAAPAGRLARGRMSPRKMNKTEAAYDQHLWLLRHAGEVLWHDFEAIKLRLADDTYYIPDFNVLVASGYLEMHEIKGGFWRDDARVKIKCAAALFPFRFRAMQKAGNGWKVEEF